MIRYIAIVYLLLFVTVALLWSRQPDPLAHGPYSFPALTTNYMHGAP